MQPRPLPAEANQELDRQVLQGREAFRERQWQKAFDVLFAADAARPLGPEGLEMLAWSARWTGQYSEWTRAMQRAEELYVQIGKRRGAGRMTVYLAHHYFEAGNEAVSQGYAARASRLLELRHSGRSGSGEHCLQTAAARTAFGSRMKRAP